MLSYHNFCFSPWLSFSISGLTELNHYDLVPEPEVVKAALQACRRVNDFALCVRFLEGVKMKCGWKKNRELVYGYIVKEVS